LLGYSKLVGFMKKVFIPHIIMPWAEAMVVRGDELVYVGGSDGERLYPPAVVLGGELLQGALPQSSQVDMNRGIAWFEPGERASDRVLRRE